MNAGAMKSGRQVILPPAFFFMAWVSGQPAPYQLLGGGFAISADR